MRPMALARRRFATQRPSAAQTAQGRLSEPRSTTQLATDRLIAARNAVQLATDRHLKAQAAEQTVRTQEAAETDALVLLSAAAQAAEAVEDRHNADRTANQFAEDQLHQERT